MCFSPGNQRLKPSSDFLHPTRFVHRALNCFVFKYAFSSNFPLHHSNFFSPRFLPALRWVGASRAMARLQRDRYVSASWPNNNDRHPCRHCHQAAASMTAVMHHSTGTLKANAQHDSTVETVAPSKHHSMRREANRSCYQDPSPADSVRRFNKRFAGGHVYRFGWR